MVNLKGMTNVIYIVELHGRSDGLYPSRLSFVSINLPGRFMLNSEL